MSGYRLSVVSLLFVSLFFPYVSNADILDNWHWIDPLPQGYSLITYGNGLFVAVGLNGTILTSADLSTWTLANSNTTNQLYAVSYAGGIFIAVGAQGAILTSSDGVAWTLRNSGTSQYLNEIAYGGGTFVVVGGTPPNPGTILTSLDGEVWTEQSYPGRGPFWGVAYGNNTFVAVGGDAIHIMPNYYYHGIILASSDAATWRSVLEFNDRWLFDITYGDGIFVALPGPLVSSDGFKWSEIDLTGSVWITAVTYGFGTFVAVGFKSPNPGEMIGIILTSTDGVTWSERSVPGDELLHGIIYGNGTFIAVGGDGKILQSDPLEVEIQSPPNNTHLNSCSLIDSVTFSWRDQEIFRNYEIQFSPDQAFSSIATRIKTSATSATIKQIGWKRILKVLEKTGGGLYWRVVGTKPDGTTTLSEVRSIIIDPPEAAAIPAIQSTARGSLPELSWGNNCNVKFKTVFGSDKTFSKKSACSFTVKNPNGNGGNFVKTLAPNQWKSIRRLVGDETGFTIYWYIESWDEIGRHTKTAVMSFELTE
jgi:hypothetical protein